MREPSGAGVTVTFAGSGDAFGSGGRYQACIHLRPAGGPPVLLDCGATSLSALKSLGLDPGEIGTVFVSHLHGDHFGGLPFLILDGQFSRRTRPLTVAGPPGTGARLQQAMELMFPGSATVARRFGVDVVELTPGTATAVAGIQVTSWEVSHPSGAPPLALRLRLGGKTVAYTGDTGWTGDLVAVAAGADLLIAEAYYFDQPVPHHLRHTDLSGHRAELASRRVVLTHLSADMLAHRGELGFEAAHDGLVIQL
ncbi:MAG TPA: MBL fold metallo-hydrolase [Streptosporangiaceae bacterium]